MDALDDLPTRVVRERAAGETLQSQDRGRHVVRHVVGEAEELAAEVDLLIEVCRDAENAIVLGAATCSRAPRLLRAFAIACALGDDRGSDVSLVPGVSLVTRQVR